MDSRTVLTKTGKGLMEASGKTSLLTRELRNLLKEVDGKARVSELQKRVDRPEPKVLEQLRSLEKDGFVREFVGASQGAGPSSQAPAPQNSGGGGGEDLDFTAVSPKPVSRPQETAKPPQRPTSEINRIAAEIRAKEEAAARARAEAEAQARQKAAEAAARAQAEAAARAQAEAKARADAAARAASESGSKNEAEALQRKLAEARAKREAEQYARQEAEEKAKKEEQDWAYKQAEVDEARRLAADKPRLDAESAKKRELEERARKEAEDKARREAEERDRRAAEEKAAREAQERQKREADSKLDEEGRAKAETDRLAHEAGEKARRETEERMAREAAEMAREEAGRKARQEAERQAKEQAAREAGERARRETEERLKREQDERESLARIEAETRARVEAELRAKAQAEEKARREAEERARREAEEKARRETEERVRREAEEKARREAEEKARKEAEEKARREEAAAREREEEEEKARKEKAKEEKARAKADAEAAAQARKEARAREKTEAEERKRIEAEASEKAQASAAKGTGGVPYAPPRRRKGWGKPVALTIFVLLAAAIGIVHIMPMNGYIPVYEKLASDYLGQPVTIGAIYMGVLPTPQIRFEKVAIGREPQARIAVMRASPELSSLFGDNKIFKLVELEGASLPQEMLGGLLWGKPGGGQMLRVGNVSARGMKINVKGIALPALDVETVLAADGRLQRATLSDSDKKIVVKLQADGGNMQVEINSKSFQPPFGTDLVLEDFSAKGVLTSDGLSLSEIEAHIFEGITTGNARLKWGSEWTLDGEIATKLMEPSKFIPKVLSSGRLEGKATYAMRATNSEALFASTRLDGTFKVEKGTLNGIDFTRVLQQSGQMGGTTVFSEMNGSVSVDGGRVQLRNLRMSAGLLLANGTAEVGVSQDLSGRVTVELRSAQTQGRSTLNLSGNINEQIQARR